MPEQKPPPKNAKLKNIETENADIRKLREDAEAIRRDVATLHGRLDIIETFLKLDIKTWEPTESQRAFAKKYGFNLPVKAEEDSE